MVKSQLTGNICGNKIENNEPATQGYGIVESGTSDRNIITGNVASDNSAADVTIIGRETVSHGNVVTSAEEQ